MNGWTPRRLLIAIPGAILLGLLAVSLLQSPPRSGSADQRAAEPWRMPELGGDQGEDTARRIIARRPFGETGSSSTAEQQGEVEVAAEAARRAAEARALREAHTWRFVGSIEQGTVLRAVFRAGDGRARRLVAGEEIEHGARLVELTAHSAVIELPRRLRAQNELPETEGPVRLQLFRDTEFNLYIEEE